MKKIFDKKLLLNLFTLSLFFVGGILFYPNISHAAVTVDSVGMYGSGFSQSGQTITFSQTIAAGSCLELIAVDMRSSSGLVQNVYVGTHLAHFVANTTRDGGNTPSNIQLWALANPPSGVQTVSATANASNVIWSFAGISFLGCDGTLGTPVKGVGTGTSYSTTVTSAVGNLVFDAGSQDLNGSSACSASSATPGGSQTQQWGGNSICSDTQNRFYSSTIPGASSVSPSWTLSPSTGSTRIAVDIHAGTYSAPVAGSSYPGILYDMWTDMENCTDSSVLTSACLQNSTHTGTGTWSASTGAGKMTASTNAASTVQGGSLGAVYTTTATEVGYDTYTFLESPTSASIGFALRTADMSALPSLEGPHIVGFHTFGGQGVRISDERSSGVSAGVRQLRLSPGSNSIPTTSVTVTDNTWYWVTIRSVLGGITDMSVYSLPSMTLVGTATTSTVGTVYFDYLWIGNNQLEGAGAAYTEYIDNLIVDTTNITYPLLPKYTIGGTISGLSGTVVLQNNTGDDLSVSANGSFTFGTSLVGGASYSVTVSSQPAGQTCTVGSGSGTVSSANVTNVSVTCSNNTSDISSAGVTGFTAPATGSTPQVFGNLTPGSAQYTVTGLTWSPTDNPFHAATAYTATVVLTSAATYKFPVGGIAVPTANGGGTVSAGTTSGGDVSGNQLTFTVLFPSTAAKTTPTLSVTNSPVTYNTSPQAATVSGSVAGVVSNIQYNGSATVPTTAGTYAITADFVPTDTADYNSLTGASAGNFVINPANQGTLTAISTPSTVPYGTTATLSSSGGSGTGAVTFSVGASTGCNITGGTTLNVSNPAGTCTVTATKAADINYNSATSAGLSVTLTKGTQATLTVTGLPASAVYQQAGITAGTSGGSGTGAVTFSAGASTACSIDSSTGAVAINASTGSCLITATKAADTNYNSVSSSEATFTINAAAPTSHTITASVGANGSISPSGAVSVNNGSDQTFTITPNSDYHIDTVTADSVAVSATSPYIFTNVTTDHTISATFAADPVSTPAPVIVSSGGGGGSPALWTLPSMPASGFKLSINNGSLTTSNRNVTLNFNAGADIKKIAISMTGDFTDASQEDYTSTKQWDLCSKFGGLVKNQTCSNGTYKVYAQFYTAYGRTSASAMASSSITLTNGVTNTTSPTLPKYNFTRNLSLHSTGKDVKALQQYLNSNGFVISKTGAGSPGKETTLFGTLTYKALVKFQKSLGWSGTGFFGPMTRDYINKQ